MNQPLAFVVNSFDVAEDDRLLVRFYIFAFPLLYSLFLSLRFALLSKFCTGNTIFLFSKVLALSSLFLSTGHSSFCPATWWWLISTFQCELIALLGNIGGKCVQVVEGSKRGSKLWHCGWLIDCATFCRDRFSYYLLFFNHLVKKSLRKLLLLLFSLADHMNDDALLILLFLTCIFHS